jgi:phage shock protein PspC (stress-responsive transcriptional regulator)
MSHGVLGGVAAGIAEYVGIDSLIVRVAFVALTFFGGSGVLLYLAGWLLLPDHAGRALARDWMDHRPSRRSAALVVLGAVVAVVAVSDLVASRPWSPHWNHGIGFVFGLVALTLTVVLLALSGANRTAASRLRWLLVSMLVAVLALTTVSAASVFSVEALSGVPLRGGIGDTEWRPTTPAQVSPRYQLAVGNATVNLTAVKFAAGTTDVTATVGVGRLRVEVPSGPIVSVTAHSGLGNVEVFGRDDSGISTVQRTTSDGSAGDSAGRARLVLDAEAGVGQVQVVRTNP